MTTEGREIPGREKRSAGGFRIFLYVLLAVGGLGVLTCGALLFVAARNPAVREFAETMVGSQSAPGTQPLRDAGCEVAQVFDLGSALEFVSVFARRGLGEAEALRDLTMVQCVLSGSDTSGLGCDEVAEIYSSAVPDPPERFLVVVMNQFSSQVTCQVVYAADGTPIAPLDEYRPDSVAEKSP